jgi:hypothetical protein
MPYSCSALRIRSRYTVLHEPGIPHIAEALQYRKREGD